jgi:hypothetical protein
MGREQQQIQQPSIQEIEQFARMQQQQQQQAAIQQIMNEHRGIAAGLFRDLYRDLYAKKQPDDDEVFELGVRCAEHAKLFHAAFGIAYAYKRPASLQEVLDQLKKPE